MSCMNLKNKCLGFTLAETLITLVIVGVIAAITVPIFIHKYQEKVNSERFTNIVYKITQASDLMRANGAMIEGFVSTDAFVDELQKYLKIMKRCDSNHIDDCWPTKTVTTSDNEEYKIKDAKTRQDLGFKTNKDNKNVSIVLIDGASIIMTYNPMNVGINIGNSTISSTSGLAFITDINGGKGPNKENVDIRNFNGASFSTCPGTKNNGSCFSAIATPSVINCRENSTNKFCNGSGLTADRWAGAANDCDSIGLKLPTMDELRDICNNDDLREKLDVNNETFRHVWGDLHPSVSAIAVSFAFGKYWCNQGQGYTGRDTTNLAVICIEQ